MGKTAKYKDEITRGLSISLDEAMHVITMHLNYANYTNQAIENQQKSIAYTVAELFENDTPLAKELLEKLITE